MNKVLSLASVVACFLGLFGSQGVLSQSRKALKGCQSFSPSRFKEQDVFESIPQPLRARLIERFKLLIQYRRTRRWEKLYELLSTEAKRGRSKEEVVRDYRNHPGVAGTGYLLASFTPKFIAASNNADDEWIISGCAKLKGVSTRIDAFVIARREGNDWYFSDVDALIPRDTDFKPCSHEARPSSEFNRRRPR